LKRHRSTTRLRLFPSLFFVCLTGPLLAGSGTITELFISEYIEGSSFNKALEIFNGTGGPVDLATEMYTVEIYYNGNGSPGDTINLTGTLMDNDVIVLAHSSADGAILTEADIVTSDVNFNGNDAVVLKRNGVVIDAIGQIGNDPGSEWGSGSVSTQNNTIVRKDSVCEGETDASDAYDPSAEWDGFASNTFTDLGSHTTVCATGAGAVIANCNSPAVTTEGMQLVHQVSGTDSDGTVVDLQIVTVDPVPTPGSITLGNLVPAGSVGGTATADITISDQVPAGSYTVTVRATNNDGVPETRDCDLIVQISGQFTIAEIQGTPLSQGPEGASPLVGLSVQTTGVVTAVKADGYFMQMPMGDGDPDSSDGIFVFTNAAPGVLVGDEVQVNGEVVEFFGYTELSNTPFTQILSSGNPLPAYVEFTSDFPDPTQPLSQLERVEGMLVSLQNGTIVTPGNLSFGIEIFYAVPENTNRNLREAGLEPPGLPNLPLFDGNPEAIRIDVEQLAKAGGYVQPTAGQTVSAQGPMEFAFSEYRLLAEPGFSIGGMVEATPVRDRQTGEFTVASFNMQFLDASDTDKTLKASNAILNVLKAPDIVAMQEVVDQAALDALRNQIATDDASVNYTAVVPADSDGFNQEVAYLVKDTVSSTTFTELGLGETYPNSAAACSPETLHNRPPFVLDCTVTPPGGQAYDITLINVHMRSLSGIDDDVQGDRVRMKRFLGARSLAGHIQTMQDNDPSRKIVVLGDFNAFPFSDGYVDVAGIVAGTPGFDLIESNTYMEILDPKLRILSPWLPNEEQYSFVFGKNAQQLDLSITTDNFGCDISGYEMARVDADFPASVFGGDNTRPERASDHDPQVIYFQTNSNPLPVITVKDASVLEGTGGANTILSFGVDLCTQSNQTVTVDWSLGSGLAKAGSDFVDASGTITFPATITTQQVDVEILPDSSMESNETFFLKLENPSNAFIGDQEGEGRILNDDQVAPLELAIAPSILRLAGDQVLKAWPTGGTGQDTYAIQWEDVSTTPVFVFDPDANPAIIDTALADPAAFRVTVNDLLGNQIAGTCIIGNAIEMLAPAWGKAAPDLEWDNDGEFTITDWTAIVNFSQNTAYAYPCDP